MAYLTINGNEYVVLDDDNVTMTPFNIGEKDRAFSGGLRSTLVPAKREWVMNLRRLDPTTLAQFMTDIATNNGVPNVNGDIVGNVDVPCVVIVVTSQPRYGFVVSGPPVLYAMLNISISEQ